MTLPSTGLGTTSLGAVGGARGIGAGALRILIEFLTQYDPAALKQAEKDLADLDKLQEKLSLQELSRIRARETAQKRLNEAEALLQARIAQLGGTRARGLRGELADIERLRLGTRRDRQEATRRFEILLKQLNVTKAETAELRKIVKLRQTVAAFETQALRASQARLAVVEQQTGVESAVQRFQALRAGAASRISGLLIGGIGGFIAGGVISAGFDVLQNIFDTLGKQIDKLVDPSKAAREALAGVVEEINKLVESENLSTIEATVKVLDRLGGTAKQIAPGFLSSVAATESARNELQQYLPLLLDQISAEEYRTGVIKELAKAEALRQVPALGLSSIATEVTARRLQGVLEEELTRIIRGQAEARHAAANAANRDAAAKIDAANAAAFAAFQEEKLADAIRDRLTADQAGIDTQIEKLRSGSGESARTRALQRALENASSAGDSGAGREQANLAEERALILLRQRLRLLGTAINLEQFEGRFLLEAIDAKIKALQKQQKEQDRLNQLLDLQFRMSQTLRRNEGETIQEFQERRAQHNRELLSEQRKLEQDAVIDKLQELRESTQDEVALAQLAERQKEAAARRGADARIKAIRKALEASQRADKAALESQIKALEEQKKKKEKQVNDLLKILSKQHRQETLMAIGGAKTVTQLSQIAGRIQGAQAAKAFLQGFAPALVLSGALTQEEVNRALSNLNAIIGAFQRKLTEFGAAPPPHGFEDQFRGLQHGGVMLLNNASRPFGQNIRLGEAGTELGVVLSNKVVKALREEQGGTQFGDIIINRSDDPLRDRYMFKRAVKEAVQEALRG